MYTKEELIEEIIQIREEIGHEYVEPAIRDVHYHNDELTIIAPDRPEKSIIIDVNLHNIIPFQKSRYLHPGQLVKGGVQGQAHAPSSAEALLWRI